MNRTTLKAVVLLAVAALAVIATGGTAEAAKAKGKDKSQRVSIDVQAALLTQEGNVGTLAGVGQHKIGKTIGQGGLVYKRTQISPTEEQPVGTYYTDDGAISGVGAIDIVLPENPSDPVTYTGTLKISKGTGIYKGAHGTLDTYGAATDATLSQVDIHIRGKLRYGGSK